MKNILDILKEDHQELKMTMKQLVTAPTTERYDECFNRFKEEFKAMIEAEEEVFYPELKRYSNLTKLINKGIEAHHLVKMGLLELRLISFQNERWPAKFSVMCDSVLNHIEEEEDVLFPKVAAAVNDELLEAMGNKVLDQRAPRINFNI